MEGRAPSRQSSLRLRQQTRKNYKTDNGGSDEESDESGNDSRFTKKPKKLKRGEYVADEILDDRIVNGVQQFYIKWKGYNLSDSTWEPQSNLIRADRQIQEYFQRKRICQASVDCTGKFGYDISGFNDIPSSSSSSSDQDDGDNNNDDDHDVRQPPAPLLQSDENVPGTSGTSFGTVNNNEDNPAETSEEATSTLSLEMKKYISEVLQIMNNDGPSSLSQKHELDKIIRNELSEQEIPLKIFASRSNWDDSGQNVHLVRIKSPTDAIMEFDPRNVFDKATKNNVLVVTSAGLIKKDPTLLAKYYDDKFK